MGKDQLNIFTDILHPEFVYVEKFERRYDWCHEKGDKQRTQEAPWNHTGKFEMVILKVNEKSSEIQVHFQKCHFNAYLGYVQPMVQQVMNRLHIEALLHLCERRVDTVGSCNQEYQQGHRCVIFGFLLPLERICTFKSIKNGCNKYC